MAAVPPKPASNAAYAAIVRRYGKSKWDTTTASGVYDVVRESGLVQKYGASSVRQASSLLAAELRSKKK